MGKKKTYQRKLDLRERKAKMRRRRMLSLMIHHLMLPQARDSISASKMRVMWGVLSPHWLEEILESNKRKIQKFNIFTTRHFPLIAQARWVKTTNQMLIYHAVLEALTSTITTTLSWDKNKKKRNKMPFLQI
jgi:hypothetical protein